MCVFYTFLSQQGDDVNEDAIHLYRRLSERYQIAKTKKRSRHEVGAVGPMVKSANLVCGTEGM